MPPPPENVISWIGGGGAVSDTRPSAPFVMVIGLPLAPVKACGLPVGAAGLMGAPDGGLPWPIAMAAALGGGGSAEAPGMNVTFFGRRADGVRGRAGNADPQNAVDPFLLCEAGAHCRFIPPIRSLAPNARAVVRRARLAQATPRPLAWPSVCGTSSGAGEAAPEAGSCPAACAGRTTAGGVGRRTTCQSLGMFRSPGTRRAMASRRSVAGSRRNTVRSRRRCRCAPARIGSAASSPERSIRTCPRPASPFHWPNRTPDWI